MTTTSPAKKMTKTYTPDERRSRADLLEDLLRTDAHFDAVQRHNNRRFRVTEYDGRTFDIVIEDR